MKKLLAALLVSAALLQSADAGEEFFKKTGSATAFNITSATVVKTGDGVMVGFAVITAGSTVGTINDVATTGAAAVGNQIAPVPNTVGVYLSG
jgi:hypothetical protein